MSNQEYQSTSRVLEFEGVPFTIVEHSAPRSHIEIDGFLTDAELKAVTKEIRGNIERLQPSKYEVDHVEKVRPDIKSSLSYSINSVQPELEKSVIRLLMYNRLVLNDSVNRAIALANDAGFQALRFTTRDNTRVTCYGSGDFYNWHTDQSPGGFLTVLLTLSISTKNFTGGDFELEWNNERKLIPFKHNRLVVFPRNTPHRVQPITCGSRDILECRTSIQFFPDF